MLGRLEGMPAGELSPIERQTVEILRWNAWGATRSRAQRRVTPEDWADLFLNKTRQIIRYRCPA